MRQIRLLMQTESFSQRIRQYLRVLHQLNDSLRGVRERLEELIQGSEVPGSHWMRYTLVYDRWKSVQPTNALYCCVKHDNGYDGTDLPSVDLLNTALDPTKVGNNIQHRSLAPGLDAESLSYNSRDVTPRLLYCSASFSFSFSNSLPTIKNLSLLGVSTILQFVSQVLFDDLDALHKLETSMRHTAPELQDQRPEYMWHKTSSFIKRLTSTTEYLVIIDESQRLTVRDIVELKMFCSVTRIVQRVLFLGSKPHGQTVTNKASIPIVDEYTEMEGM